MFKEYMEKLNAQPGVVMWSILATQLCHRLRNYPFMNRIEVKKLPCESFRAGRATQLIEDGFAIGHVLAQGGWRSVQGVQPYVNVKPLTQTGSLCQFMEVPDNDWGNTARQRWVIGGFWVSASG